MDSDLHDVARTIRPYLKRLAKDKAHCYDAAIRDLLTEGQAGADVDARLVAVLSGSPELHTWTAGVLADPAHRPPEAEPTRTAYQRLPGAAEPVAAIKYVCPVDRNYAWWRISVGDRVPQCPDHPAVTLAPV